MTYVKYALYGILGLILLSFIFVRTGCAGMTGTVARAMYTPPEDRDEIAGQVKGSQQAEFQKCKNSALVRKGLSLQQAAAACASQIANFDLEDGTGGAASPDEAAATLKGLGTKPAPTTIVPPPQVITINLVGVGGTGKKKPVVKAVPAPAPAEKEEEIELPIPAK